VQVGILRRREPLGRRRPGDLVPEERVPLPEDALDEAGRCEDRRVERKTYSRSLCSVA